MTDPLDNVRMHLELIQEGSLDARARAGQALAELDSLKPCVWCEGKGYEVYNYSDPNCGNCNYGDCDYGHQRNEVCTYCHGTGRSGKK